VERDDLILISVDDHVIDPPDVFARAQAAFSKEKVSR
jgi:hypothetical protein